MDGYCMKPNQQHRLLKSADGTCLAAASVARPIGCVPEGGGQSKVSVSSREYKASSNFNRDNAALLLKSGTSIHIPLLAPMLAPENVLNKLQGAPSNLIKVRDGVQSDGCSDSKEHLRRRIKDLERDVIKLTNHVRQAEQSIQSYRTCLSDKSPRPSDRRDFASQTDSDAVSQLQLSLKVSDDRIGGLISELTTLRETKDLLFRERQQLSEAARGKEQALQGTIAEHRGIIQEQSAHLLLLQDRIIDLEKSLVMSSGAAEMDEGSNMGVASVAIQAEPPVDVRIVSSAVKSLRESIAAMERKFSSEMEALLNRVVVDYHTIATTAGVQLRSMSLRLEEQSLAVKKLQSENDDLLTQLVTKTELLKVQTEQLSSFNVLSSQSDPCLSDLQSASSPSDHLNVPTDNNISQHSPTSVIDHPTIDQLVLISSPIKHEQFSSRNIDALRILQADDTCSKSRSPNGSDYVTAIQETQYKLRLAEIEAEYSERLKQVEIKHRLQMRRQENMAEDKMRQLDGGFRQQMTTLSVERDRLAVAHGAEQLCSMGYKQRLADAATALMELQEIHSAEIKSVKHEAHVKDLIRVGKERESSLERDRLLIELSHLKEVQNILMFSLSTAEQSLGESQPHAVMKLSTGRAKRLKLVEQSSALRLRDLDQRSRETCAVSSAHLDGFQRKASDNQAHAREMSSMASDKLMSLLSIP